MSIRMDRKELRKLKEARLQQLKEKMPELFEEKSKEAYTNSTKPKYNPHAAEERAMKHNAHVIECLRKGDKRYSVKDIIPIV